MFEHLKRKKKKRSYEGKEHIKYFAPETSREDIRYPEDEPHMKSHVSKQEMHEAEDNYHAAKPPKPKKFRKSLALAVIKRKMAPKSE